MLKLFAGFCLLAGISACKLSQDLFAKELLYIDHAHIYHLPSFSPATSCQVPRHPIPVLVGAVAGLSNGSLVICGGYSGGYQSACHTLTANGWEKSASLPVSAYNAAASYDDRMVVTGGYGDDGYLSTTLTYEHSQSQWSEGPEMPHKLSEHCQVSVNDGSVVITGGGNPDVGIFATMIQMKNNRWVTMPSMKTARQGHVCVIHEGELYTIGGENTATVEIFSFNTNRWRAGPPLPAGIQTFYGQAVTSSNHLFYIGRDGQVMKLTGNEDEDGNVWDKVTDIAGWGEYTRPVFPAPVVTSDVLKC